MRRPTRRRSESRTPRRRPVEVGSDGPGSPSAASAFETEEQTAASGRARSRGGAVRDAGGMGLNPYRKMRRSPADYLMVVGAVAVCVLLVAWALFA